MVGAIEIMAPAGAAAGAAGGSVLVTSKSNWISSRSSRNMATCTK